MFNYDLNEIGSVTFQLNFDNDYYNEWLSENGVTDSRQARLSFVEDYCDYDAEYTDSDTYHHLGYATMTIGEIEDVFGHKIAMDVLRLCMDGNEHTFEPLEYQNDEVDLNDPRQLSDIAMKHLKYGKYFKGARGFILPNGVVVYTEAEHNMCSRIPGVDGTFQFIELGCIRVLPNSIDMAKMPTREQFSTIYQVLRCYEDSELYLDLMDKQIGSFSRKYSYYDPDDVVSDIERYFKRGKMRGKRLYEITMKDMRRIVAESVKRILREQQSSGYDTLYRGGPDTNQDFLWLTTSRLYAGNYTESDDDVFSYKVPISILDRLVDCRDIPDYLVAGCDDETPEYSPENYDTDRLMRDGYTGYYFYEDEYNCLCVCLFKKAVKQRLAGKPVSAR